MTVDNTMTAESPPPVTSQKDNRPTAFIPYSDEPPPSPDIEPSAVLEQQRLLMEGEKTHTYPTLPLHYAPLYSVVYLPGILNAIVANLIFYGFKSKMRILIN